MNGAMNSKRNARVCTRIYDPYTPCHLWGTEETNIGSRLPPTIQYLYFSDESVSSCVNPSKRTNGRQNVQCTYLESIDYHLDFIHGSSIFISPSIFNSLDINETRFVNLHRSNEMLLLIDFPEIIIYNIRGN